MAIQRADTFAGRTVASGFGTASDGHVWAKQAGDGQSVSSGEGRIANSSASTLMTLGASLPGADAEALVRFSLDDASNTGGAFVRFIDTSNYYLARYDGNGHIAFFKDVAGTKTTVGSYAFTPANSTTFYWLRFHVQGTTIQIRTWQDGSAEPGTWNYSTTDSSLPGTGGSANYVGLYGFANFAGSNNFDSFSVDDLASGAINGKAAGLSGAARGAAETTLLTGAGGAGPAARGRGVVSLLAAGAGHAGASGAGRVSSLSAANGRGVARGQSQATLLAAARGSGMARGSAHTSALSAAGGGLGRAGVGAAHLTLVAQAQGSGRAGGTGHGALAGVYGGAGISRGTGGAHPTLAVVGAGLSGQAKAGQAHAALLAHGAGVARAGGSGHAALVGLTLPGACVLADTRLAQVALADAQTGLAGACLVSDAPRFILVLADVLATAGACALADVALFQVALLDVIAEKVAA